MRYIKLFIILVWVLNICVVGVLIISDTIVYFNPTELDCSPYLSSKTKIYWMVMYSLYILVPLTMIIITNICILFLAAKRAKKRAGDPFPSISAVITVSCICWVYVASYIPIFIRTVINTPSWFTYFSIHSLSVSVTTNPIIYTITNNRFRCFVRRIIVAKRKNSDVLRHDILPNTGDKRIRQAKVTIRKTFGCMQR